MNDSSPSPLSSLADHISRRREAILQAWRNAARADPAQTTIDSLTRNQFNDHIPEVLDGFQRKLRSKPGSGRAHDADSAMGEQEVKHGIQRWQQGYTQAELMREWGHLHLCLFDEIEAYATQAPGFGREALATAHRELAQLVNEGISESALQYARMERSEAEGVAKDLERALGTVKDLQRRRAALIHQAVHDLRGNIQSVASAAEVLRMSEIAENDRVEFATLLQRGVETVATMLGDLLELARLEAGHEKRQIAPFDAGKLVTDLTRAVEPMAVQRKLFLKSDGPASLPVEGDAGKVRRLLQNLVINALKYTEHGGVTLTWGVEKSAWWIMVKDTGPGLMGGPAAPLATSIKDATIVAHESDAKASAGEQSKILDQAAAGPSLAPMGRQQAGEGIGLSIVKRLCEMLDASLELASSSDAGTTFRIVLPQRYP